MYTPYNLFYENRREGVLLGSFFGAPHCVGAREGDPHFFEEKNLTTVFFWAFQEIPEFLKEKKKVGDPNFGQKMSEFDVSLI